MSSLTEENDLAGVFIDLLVHDEAISRLESGLETIPSFAGH